MGLSASELGSAFNSQQNWAWPARKFIYYNTYISIKKTHGFSKHIHAQLGEDNFSKTIQEKASNADMRRTRDDGITLRTHRPYAT